MRAPFTPPTQPWAELKFLYERRKEEGRRKDPCLTMYLSKKKKKMGETKFTSVYIDD